MLGKILLVEDDTGQRMVLKELLEKKLSYHVLEAADGKEAITTLLQDHAQEIKLIILDIYMPNMDGKETLGQLKDLCPMVPVIILTASDKLSDAIETLKAGATDFITKPPEEERLFVSIKNALRLHELSGEVSRLKRSTTHHTSFEDLIGFNGGLKAPVELGKKAAESEIPVLISGESGVGKELLARAIHGESHRSGKPFIAINCGAIPENLVESTLFGHEKGSFTGATSKTIGKFREAEGGTIFLDEVGELKIDIQVKLLRALQQKEIEPVGAGKPHAVNVRVISATNRNLELDVETGLFRKDLFYRLNVFPITLPPLCERKNDILCLAERFLERYTALENKIITKMDDEVKAYLKNYHWPGNVRELENLIFRGVLLCEGNVLLLEDMLHSPNSFVGPTYQEDTVLLAEQSEKNLDTVIPFYHPSRPSIQLQDTSGKPKTLEEMTQEIIEIKLKQHHDNIGKVAKELGIGQSTLYRKLSKQKFEKNSKHSE